MLKDFFKEKNQAYTEKLVDMDDTAKEEMMRESEGFLGVPFIVFVKDDGTKEHVIGFDKGKISSILGK